MTLAKLVRGITRLLSIAALLSALACDRPRSPEPSVDDAGDPTPSAPVADPPSPQLEPPPAEAPTLRTRPAAGDVVPNADAPDTPSAALLAQLWARAPEAANRVAIDVVAANARLSTAAWNPFARTPADQASIWQRLLEPFGARFADPAALQSLVIASGPLGVTVFATGTEIVAERGIVTQADGYQVWRDGELPSAPAEATAPLDPRAILTVRSTLPTDAGETPWPSLSGLSVRAEVFTDESLAVTFEGTELARVSGELGRAQAYASFALGQLRSSAPVELQGFVTLATRWLEALWARIVLEPHPAGARVGLPTAACGHAPRTLFAAGAVAGLMSAAQHDEAALASPFHATEATITDGCVPAERLSVLPLRHASLSALPPHVAEVLVLGDALAWVRSGAPDAFGLLPFALPPEGVATALGGRPLGMLSLHAPAGVAVALHANGTRSAAMPATMARWLGTAPLFTGAELQLLDADTLLLVPPGSGARARMLAEEAPSWTAMLTTLPADTTTVVALSRSSFLPLLQGPRPDLGPLGGALGGAEVVVFYRRSTGATGLAAWPVADGVDPAAIARDWPDWWVRRALSTGVQSAANEARLLAFTAAMEGTVSVSHASGTLLLEAASALPWVRAAVEIGVPALAEGITRGRITPPATLPVFRPGSR